METRTNHSQASPGGGTPAARFCPRRRVFPLLGALAELSGAEALSRLRLRRNPVLLDSAGGQPRTFSLLAFDPLPWSCPRTWAELRLQLASFEVQADSDVLPFEGAPFGGGFAGALSYDLGVEGEELVLPRDPWNLPTVTGGLYCDFFLRDEQTGRNWLVLGEEPGDGRADLKERKQTLEASLGTQPATSLTRPLAPLKRRVSSALHCERVEAARQQIARGEIYQANLAHPFEREMEGDPVDLYLRLRAASPTPYASFLRADDDLGHPRFALLSCSPELLLELDPGQNGAPGLARTRPIKGTAARPVPLEGQSERDQQAARELLASHKDRAELAMIVDLERNDLGRLAVPGGVSVGSFPELESHSGVHHLMADVEARLRAGVGPVDVLAALFPGGSITGAPKLRSMEVIAELEREGRGFAFGSAGCLDAAGSARFNLLIRTCLWRPQRLSCGSGKGQVRGHNGPIRGELLLRVGGGITWGSEPKAEDLETLTKASALLGALE